MRLGTGRRCIYYRQLNEKNKNFSINKPSNIINLLHKLVQYMSEISIIKDLITPLLTACIGTAGGAYIVNFANNNKIQYEEKSQQIKFGNSLVAECNTQINSLFNYYEEINRQYSSYKEQEKIALLFCDYQNSQPPEPDMQKHYLDKIDQKEIKKLSSQSQSGLKILSAASQYSILIPLIQTYEIDLHKKFDEVSQLIREEKHEVALKDFFGINYKGLTNDIVEPCYINLINFLKISILLLDEIANLCIAEKNNLKKQYEKCSFRQLPKVVKIDLSAIRSKDIYP
ncbi:MAG: hypothetical protein ACN6NT_02950, partial [Comamonas sp.]